jgi:hypothetical protein
MLLTAPTKLELIDIQSFATTHAVNLVDLATHYLDSTMSNVQKYKALLLNETANISLDSLTEDTAKKLLSDFDSATPLILSDIKKLMDVKTQTFHRVKYHSNDINHKFASIPKALADLEELIRSRQLRLEHDKEDDDNELLETIAQCSSTTTQRLDNKEGGGIRGFNQLQRTVSRISLLNNDDKGEEPVSGPGQLQKSDSKPSIDYNDYPHFDDEEPIRGPGQLQGSVEPLNAQQVAALILSRYTTNSPHNINSTEFFQKMHRAPNPPPFASPAAHDAYYQAPLVTKRLIPSRLRKCWQP